MSEGVRDSLRRALRMMMKPLVRLLISQGVTHADFSESAKDVYVEVAIRSFCEGSKINQSRVAVLTGLTRKEVKNVLVRASEGEAREKQFSKPSKMLFGWYHDPEFAGPYGIPLELAYDSGEDDHPDFKALAKRYGADMPARQLLNVLIGAGAVIDVGEGKYKVVTQRFEPQALSEELLERFGYIAQNFFSTAAANIEVKDKSRALFERVVTATRPLSQKEIDALSSFIKEHGQALLERIDNEINGYVDLGDVAAKETGLGMYHYVEDPADRATLKDLIDERGLDVK